ncbi:MAG: thioesterase family protein [Actinobacteria bacterium]|nr:thioesterase family protein [Actinomycetota bacterium]
MDWDDAVAVEHVGDGRFRSHVDEQWTSLQGVHGGIVAAQALAAVEHVLRSDGVEPSSTLRAATFGYVRGNVVGDLVVAVEIVRRGRSMVTTHATVLQDDRVTTVARFHHSPPCEGVEWSDVPPPIARPEGTVRLHIGDRPAHLDNVETHLHPDTLMFAGNDRAEWIAWSRPLAGDALDSRWLTMYGDYFPPAVFASTTAPQRAVTIEYSIQIHSAAGRWSLGEDGYLAARMHATHAHEGFAVEDGWIHMPDGSLLATTRQTRLAG